MEVDQTKAVAQKILYSLWITPHPPPPPPKKTLFKWTNLFSNTSRHLLLVFENTLFRLVDSLPSDMLLLYFGKMKRSTIDAKFMADFSSRC